MCYWKLLGTFRNKHFDSKQANIVLFWPQLDARNGVENTFRLNVRIRVLLHNIFDRKLILHWKLIISMCLIAY
jgi:hypothetical protein